MGIWDDFKPERQASWDDIAQAIHDTITMGDVIRHYCPDLLPRRNRIPCPIHSGKDYNFSYTDTGYKCFVCGESGDVVKFVQTICQLRTRSDAMTKINADFRLGLPLDRKISLAENKAFNKRRNELERKRREHDEWYVGLMALWDEYIRLDRQRMFCSPCSNPWVEAVTRIDGVKYQIDCYPEEPR